MNILRLNYQEKMAFVSQLEESHFLTIPKYLLENDLADIYLDEQQVNYVIQSKLDPGEPTGFGEDAIILWEILKNLHDWRCINVSQELAKPLLKVIKNDWKCAVREYGDVYYGLNHQVRKYENQAVRKLITEDKSLLAAFGFDNTQLMENAIDKGFAYGAVIENQLVSLSYAPTHTLQYIEIGVETKEGYRNQGYSTAASAMLLQDIQTNTQLIPTWSAGEDNYASIKVAEKLGFEKLGERVYLILTKKP
ncbi:MAG: GNAT family N-acetyltransferase [Flammeovirgaceae bacterium]